MTCVTLTFEADKHMHSCDIPLADVEAGVEKTYDVGGQHMHMVTITAEEFATLKEMGEVVVYQPPDELHDHNYTIGCTFE